MKLFTYLAGVVLAVAASLLIVARLLIITPSSGAIAAEGSTTFMMFKCIGANIFLVPPEVEASVQFSIVDPVIATVDISHPVAGGNSSAVIYAAGDSTTSDWVYAIFAAPKMRHIFSCLGEVVSAANLDWKYVADNPDMFVGTAPAGTTNETAFTRVTGTDTTVYLDKTKDPIRPFFTWDDGDYNLIMKGYADTDTGAGSEERMDVTFTSTPHP